MTDLFTYCAQRAEAMLKAATEGSDPAPHVSTGGSGITRPFEASVMPMPRNASFEDLVTSRMGSGSAKAFVRVSFRVQCRAWAVMADEEKAAQAVLGWVEGFIRQVAADRTLGGRVVHAEPFMLTGSTGVTSKREHAAQIDFGIQIKADIGPAC